MPYGPRPKDTFIGDEAVPLCELCGGERRQRWRVEGWTISRCPQCGLHVTEPKPSAASVEELYEDEAYYDGAMAHIARMKEWNYARITCLDRLCSGKMDKTLLEIGCAHGHFLVTATQHGWDIWGVDWSAMQRKSLPKSLEGRVWTDLSNVPDGKLFDVVCLWEVLEHQYESVAFLDGVAAKISDGGVLALSTPNIGGLVATLMGQRFPMIIPPNHLSYWSPNTLRVWAQRRGFKVEMIRGFSGITHNEAKSLLRRRARMGPLSGAFAPLVTAAFKLLDVVEKGTEYEAFLRKV
jgi:2-polyprenyl-3-methyl-5-hydroxy-6-metoxy-1,4-benzoquinol methylase